MGVSEQRAKSRDGFSSLKAPDVVVIRPWVLGLLDVPDDPRKETEVPRPIGLCDDSIEERFSD
jgi:hypothetical protein